MKRLLSIFLIGVFILSSLASVGAIDHTIDELKIMESIFISNPIIKEEDQYLTVNLIESESYLLHVGKPMLPVIKKVFTFPFGSKINGVEVNFSKANELLLQKKIKPVPEPVPMTIDMQIQENIKKNIDIYESKEIYPSESYSYTIGAGLDGEKHVIYLVVHCYPVRYSPINNVVYFSENLNIEINYEEPKNFALFTDVYDLAVIAPETFSSKLQRLIDHKNSHGVRTFLKTTESIYSEYSGSDRPEQIKYFIKEALETWNIKHVLLIGDVDLLPIRETAIRVYKDNEILTDLYYADIYDYEYQFCSWDSNDNGLFGEYSWDEGRIDFVDMYADVNVGRLPCKNNHELDILIDKILIYENQTNEKNWFRRMILMGGDTFPNHGVYEGEVVTEQIAQIMDGFEPVKLWTSTSNFNPLSINLEINAGAGFVSYSGHGYEQGFGTSPPNEENRIEYYAPYILGIFNGYKLPVIFFDACSTARLDFTIGDLDEWYPSVFKLYSILTSGKYDSSYFPCFAWMLLKKSNGGAIATIGSTRVAFTHVDSQGPHWGAGYLNLHFFKAYEPGIAVSQMLTEAQNDYINYVGYDCITLEEFSLLGDPSLKIGGY